MQLEKKELWFEIALREICSVLTEDQKERLRRTRIGRSLEPFF